MNELTDNELMLLVKAGDLDKMSLLFKRYNMFLYNFLFQMIYDREASEDIVQNTFYRMLKYRQTFTGSGEFKVWMFHLGRNLLKDHLRNSQKKGKQEEVHLVAENLEGGLPADGQINKKQEQAQLQKAMKQLTNEEREILTLSKFKELRYHEIAQILEINEGAVKVRVHRAFTRLKNIYQKNGLI